MTNSFQEIAPTVQHMPGVISEPSTHRMNQDVPTGIATPFKSSVTGKLGQVLSQVDSGEVPSTGGHFDTPSPGALHEHGAATSSTHNYKGNSRIGHVVHPTRI